MSRAIYVPIEEQKRLFENTLADPKNGVRNHAILRLMYGYPIRSIELTRLKTSDLATDQGRVRTRSDVDLLRPEISFNGIARPFPLQCSIIIEALQAWIDFRFQKGWGVVNGFLDMESPFFMKDKVNGFKETRTKRGSEITKSAEGMNKLISNLHKRNHINGNVESPLRSWTLVQYEKGADVRILWILRGDKTIDTVYRACRNHPVKLASLVRNVV